MWHSCPTPLHETVGMSGKGNVAGFLYLQIYLYYLCTVPLPWVHLRRYFPKKWYIISLLFYTVNVYSDYIYIYNIYISIFLGSSLVLCFCVGVFLHVWCIPQQKSQRQFWSSVCEWQAENKSRGLSQTCLHWVLFCSQWACAFIPWYLWLLGIFTWWSMRHAASSGQSQFLWHHWRHLLQPLWYALLSLFFLMVLVNNDET